MIKDAGCRYVIIGHSERRQFFNETDETVNKKVSAALRHDLMPIVCVGETLEEKEEGKTLDRVRSQVRGALAGLSSGAVKGISIAYEPIWAIGTGKTASPQEVEEVHNGLRELIYEIFETDSAKEIRIIYGGSVSPTTSTSSWPSPT